MKWAAPLSGAVGQSDSFRTLTHSGLYHLVSSTNTTQPAKSFAFQEKWLNSQTIEFVLPESFKRFTSETLAKSLKESFQSEDIIFKDALCDLIWNAKEFSDGRLPWSMVGIKVVAGNLRIQLRRKAPQLLAWILSHPATWPKDPSPDSHVEIQRSSDALARATLVVQSEADFASELPNEIIPIYKNQPLYREVDTARRIFFLFTPRSQTSLNANYRRFLIDTLDSRDFARFSETSVAALKTLFTREGDFKSGKPFEGIPPTKSSGTLPQLFTSLTLGVWTPLEDKTTLDVLNQATSHASMQLARVGIATTISLPAKSPIPFAAAMNNADIIMVALPALPLMGRAWGELFTVMGRGLASKEYENILDRWNFSRDDEKLELALEKILFQQEFLLAPYVAIRSPYLATEHTPVPAYSPFGHWDWANIARR